MHNQMPPHSRCTLGAETSNKALSLKSMVLRADRRAAVLAALVKEAAVAAAGRFSLGPARCNHRSGFCKAKAKCSL